jgi:hypothetical protein
MNSLKHYGYIRTSTVDQGRKYSLPAQREAITLDCARKYDGASIDEWFTDTETGTTADRKDFKRLQQRIQTGDPAVVHVLCVDRFARDTEDALRVSRQFYERGSKLEFVETPADLETPEGRFQFTQYAAFAAFEHARIRQRSISGRTRKMKQDHVPDSWILPYGLAVIGGTPALDETVMTSPDGCTITRAAAARLIFEWRHRGDSVYKIIDKLKALGAKPARAPLWNTTSVRKLLRSRCFIGEYSRCKNVWPILDKDGHLIQLIDPKLFAEVNAMMDARRQQNVGRPDTLRRHLLRKYVWCPKCGKRCVALVMHQQRKEYRYYRCGDGTKRYPSATRPCDAIMTRADVLEEAVWTAIWGRLSDPALVHEMAVVRQRREEEQKPLENDPRRELTSLRAEEQQVIEMTRARMYSVQQGQAIQADLRRRIGLLEMEVRELRKIVEIAPLDVVKAACAAVASGKEPRDYEARRMLLEALQDLRVVPVGEYADVRGFIPVSNAAAPAAGGKKNREHKQNAVALLHRAGGSLETLRASRIGSCGEDLVQGLVEARRRSGSLERNGLRRR